MSTAAAPRGPYPGRVRLDRAVTRPAPNSVPIVRLLLAALGGAIVVTCIAICLMLASSAPTPRAQALEAGHRVLSYLSKNCLGCTVDSQGEAHPGTWRIRLQTPHWRRCFLITPSEFAYVPGRGMVGLHVASCRVGGTGLTG